MSKECDILYNESWKVALKILRMAGAKCNGLRRGRMEKSRERIEYI